MTKKFFISYHNPEHNPAPLIRFATHVPKSLSVEDAKVLLAELTEVLKEAK